MRYEKEMMRKEHGSMNGSPMKKAEHSMKDLKVQHGSMKTMKTMAPFSKDGCSFNKDAYKY